MLPTLIALAISTIFECGLFYENRDPSLHAGEKDSSGKEAVQEGGNDGGAGKILCPDLFCCIESVPGTVFRADHHAHRKWPEHVCIGGRQMRSIFINVFRRVAAAQR